MVLDGCVLARAETDKEHGLAASLPAMVSDVLGQAGPPDLVAVVVGPGSFTGLRAGLSVGCGIALGCGIPAVGVSVAEALAEAARPMLDGRALWAAITARRGRVFLDRSGSLAGYALDDLPPAAGRVAVCGNAATEVAARLAALGCDVKLTTLRAPSLEHVAAIGLRRACGALPGLAALPIYVDAPEAKLPAILRTPPVTMAA